MFASVIPNHSHSPSAADLHKLLKNVANLPAKKDATYKECERLRRAAQVLQMADIRVALVTLVSSLKADADADGTGDICDPCPNNAGEVDADSDGDFNCNDCDDSDPLLTTLDVDQDGESTCLGDCNDLDPLVNTSGLEVANGFDDDCDGLLDEGTEWYDDDGDGYTEAGGDCDDSDPFLNPGQEETCDGLDQDCDGMLD